ncbi:effector-associated constant component EACC1 [Kitasatospora sp. NPDC001664]
MEAWLSVRGGDAVCELRELERWLEIDPLLCGRIRARAARRWRGELGLPYGVLVVAVGHGGAAGALAGALHGFLTRPGAGGVRISVSSPDGRSVRLADQRPEEVEILVREVLTAPAEDEDEYAPWPTRTGALAS